MVYDTWLGISVECPELYVISICIKACMLELLLSRLSNRLKFLIMSSVYLPTSETIRCNKKEADFLVIRSKRNFVKLKKFTARIITRRAGYIKSSTKSYCYPSVGALLFP